MLTIIYRRMKKVIIAVYSITLILGAIGTLIAMFEFPDTGERSFTAFFGGIFITGFIIFFESIVLIIVYFKHIKEVWMIILPVLLITGLVPLYFLNRWIENLPVTIPQPGKLMVSEETYNSDKEQIINDYKLRDLDSNNIKNTRDTILDVKIDTIIYSIDNTKLFSIIIAEAKDGIKTKYCTEYRVGFKQNNHWKLSVPKGNIWLTCFDSSNEFKDEIRQYFYKRYSINNSSKNPEIWDDKYIFNVN